MMQPTENQGQAVDVLDTTLLFSFDKMATPEAAAQLVGVLNKVIRYAVGEKLAALMHSPPILSPSSSS
jgi:hypothetical protein